MHSMRFTLNFLLFVPAHRINMDLYYCDEGITIIGPYAYILSSNIMYLPRRLSINTYLHDLSINVIVDD